MNKRILHVYIAGICILAAALATTLDWRQLESLTAGDFLGLGTLALLGLVAEQQAVTIRLGSRGPGSSSSIAFLPLFTTVLLFGPAATVVSMFLAGVTVEYLIRRNEPLRANFNIGQYVLSTALAGLTYSAAGGQALMTLPEAVQSHSILQQLPAFALFGIVFLVVNNTTVAGAISISQGLVFNDVWWRLVGKSGTNILSDLLIGPIAVAVAALFVQVQTWALLLAILPLLFIRQSYLLTQQLVQANQDLLKALVKAIETRDPYTSGHSLRVSYLAGRIARQLGCSSSVVDEVESAALLHDVGKIEATYTEILAKPASLSQAERETIQSHVIKGEELLRHLSSVADAVILAVRHHHEKEDGSGYPDGLRGERIPLGAKIIAVCDAVDAMLSDRPYRRALPMSTVVQQLVDGSGTQFDPAVVDALLKSGLLGEYADVMRASRSPELYPSPLSTGAMSRRGRHRASQEIRLIQ